MRPRAEVDGAEGGHGGGDVPESGARGRGGLEGQTQNLERGCRSRSGETGQASKLEIAEVEASTSTGAECSSTSLEFPNSFHHAFMT